MITAILNRNTNLNITTVSDIIISIKFGVNIDRCDIEVLESILVECGCSSCDIKEAISEVHYDLTRYVSYVFACEGNITINTVTGQIIVC